MSARIPHLLTRLLTSAELDRLEAEMLAIAEAAICTPACATWHDAVDIIRAHRDASFQRRAKQTPSARRKSLDARIQQPAAC
jgi:hypothetical protein